MIDYFISGFNTHMIVILFNILQIKSILKTYLKRIKNLFIYLENRKNLVSFRLENVVV